MESVGLSFLPSLRADFGRSYIRACISMTPIGAHADIADARLIFGPLEDRGLPTNHFGLMIKAGGGLHLAPAVFYEHAKRHFSTLDLPGVIP